MHPVRVVEAYRDNGKVKQRVVADLGRKDLLSVVLPKTAASPRRDADDRLFEQLGLWPFSSVIGRGGVLHRTSVSVVACGFIASTYFQGEAVATVRWATFHLAGQPIRHGVSGGSPHARQVLKTLGTLLRPITAAGPPAVAWAPTRTGWGGYACPVPYNKITPIGEGVAVSMNCQMATGLVAAPWVKNEETSKGSRT